MYSDKSSVNERLQLIWLGLMHLRKIEIHRNVYVHVYNSLVYLSFIKTCINVA